MNTTGFFPPALADAIRGQISSLGYEKRTRTFGVEFRIEKGRPIEARLRSRETIIVVPLST